MSKDVLAVYPGTFDPITLGHEDMLRRAAQLFNRLTVPVADVSKGATEKITNDVKLR